METLEEFSAKLRRVSDKRKIKITGSYGVNQYYKYYRKTKPKDPKYILKDVEYYKIIRSINDLLALEVSNGHPVTFPYKMGTLEIRKEDSTYSMYNGRLVKNGPVDWKRTIQLWFEDEEAKQSKILVRVNGNTIYKILYNKRHAEFRNKCYYIMAINRDLKRRLACNIRQGLIEAPKIDEYYVE